MSNVLISCQRRTYVFRKCHISHCHLFSTFIQSGWAKRTTFVQVVFTKIHGWLKLQRRAITITDATNQIVLATRTPFATLMSLSSGERRMKTKDMEHLEHQSVIR